MVRNDNSRLQVEIRSANQEKERIETALVDSKIKSANLDLENDQLACKLQQKANQIKFFSERITALEVDLLRSRQDLGEALNSVYEYEQTNADRLIAERTMKFGESSGGNNNSGGDSGNEGNNSGSLESQRMGMTGTLQSVHSGGDKKQGVEESVDGGSGSTVKKMSKKDQIKNFFKKHTNNGNGGSTNSTLSTHNK